MERVVSSNKCRQHFVIDNVANFKRARELLDQQHSILFWIPLATHCVDLMMADMDKLDIVKKVVC